MFSSQFPPLPFHRLARAEPNYRWWRPVTTVLAALLVYLGLVLAVMVPLVVLGVLVPAVGAALDQAMAAEMDLTHPGQLAFLLGTVILMWPAVVLGVRWGGGRPPGRLSSVTGRLRWSLLLRFSALAGALFVPIYGAGLLVPGLARPADMETNASWSLLFVVLALVPFQAAAEEYAFRGLLMQVIGSWLRHPAFAILLPVPLFVILHGYGLVGQIDVAAFAVAAGWATWRTGGLEAAVALHVVNNVGVLGMGAAGLLDPNATDLAPAGLLFSLVFLGGYCLMIRRWFPAPARGRAAEAYLASA